MYQSTKILELGSCAFRQWRAEGTHCKLLHGYKLHTKLWFGCNELDERNWVVSFGGLKELKEILRSFYDHKAVVASTDPLLPLFRQLHDAGGCSLVILPEVGIEKTAEHVYEVSQRFINQETKGRCWVSKVEVWEHELNSAIYIPPNWSLDNLHSVLKPVKTC